MTSGEAVHLDQLKDYDACSAAPTKYFVRIRTRGKHTKVKPSEQIKHSKIYTTSSPTVSSKIGKENSKV